MSARVSWPLTCHCNVQKLTLRDKGLTKIWSSVLQAFYPRGPYFLLICQSDNLADRSPPTPNRFLPNRHIWFWGKSPEIRDRKSWFEVSMVLSLSAGSERFVRSCSRVHVNCSYGVASIYISWWTDNIGRVLHVCRILPDQLGVERMCSFSSKSALSVGSLEVSEGSFISLAYSHWLIPWNVKDVQLSLPITTFICFLPNLWEMTMLTFYEVVLLK